MILRISVLINTGPAAKLFPWQQHNGYHFVAIVMYISGAKFEEHRCNIARGAPLIISRSLFADHSLRPEKVACTTKVLHYGTALQLQPKPRPLLPALKIPG